MKKEKIKRIIHLIKIMMKDLKIKRMIKVIITFRYHIQKKEFRKTDNQVNRENLSILKSNHIKKHPMIIKIHQIKIILRKTINLKIYKK